MKLTRKWNPDRYYIDGEEVSKDAYDAAWTPRDGFCLNFKEMDFWDRENNGKGRYISQLAKKPGDPNAYARSPGHAMEKAKRAGKEVERVR